MSRWCLLIRWFGRRQIRMLSLIGRNWLVLDNFFLRYKILNLTWLSNVINLFFLEFYSYSIFIFDILFTFLMPILSIKKCILFYTLGAIFILRLVFHFLHCTKNFKFNSANGLIPCILWVMLTITSKLSNIRSKLIVCKLFFKKPI